MDDKGLNILKDTLSLCTRQQQLLGEILAIAHEMGRCLINGETPTPSQVASWKLKNTEVSQQMQELAAAYNSVLQAADPLIRYDS